MKTCFLVISGSRTHDWVKTFRENYLPVSNGLNHFYYLPTGQYDGIHIKPDVLIKAIPDDKARFRPLCSKDFAHKTSPLVHHTMRENQEYTWYNLKTLFIYMKYSLQNSTWHNTNQPIQQATTKILSITPLHTHTYRCVCVCVYYMCVLSFEFL